MIRQGIEARRGLIVLSGAAGIGKSALLDKITADLARPKIISVIASNPSLNFLDILRLILRTLEAPSASADEAAALRSCAAHLRARLQGGQTVALIIDNAQHLDASTAKKLVQNFVETGAADRDGHLLQLVLAGRPSLKDNLSRAFRLPAHWRIPVLCELQPLEDLEIASYIEEKLRGNPSAARPLGPGVVAQIAVHSDGNPRRIDAIYDRAMQLSGNSGVITAELIKCAAEDLGLQAALGGRAATSHFAESPPPLDRTRFQFSEKDTTEIAGETFPDYDHGDDRKRRNAGLQALCIISFVLCAGAWLHSQGGKNRLAAWREQLSGIWSAPAQDAAIDTTAPSRRADLGGRSPEGNLGNSTTGSISESAAARGEAPSEAIAEPPIPPAAKTPAPNAVPPRPKTAVNPPPAGRLAASQIAPERRRDELESQIIQAIENRAIIGVAVSVTEGTAVLDGQVATERQRRAAERAARSVPGISSVRNRIAVNFG